MYLKDHLIGWIADYIYQQMPASDITCSLERYIEYARWLSGSSFTVGEVADCPVAKTVSPTSPTTAASHIPTSASTFPRARKVISNSADLVAKLANPPIISLRKSRKLNSTLRCSRSTLNQRNEFILAPKSAPVSNLQFCEQSPQMTPPPHLPVTLRSRPPSTADSSPPSAADSSLPAAADSAPPP